MSARCDQSARVHSVILSKFASTIVTFQDLLHQHPISDQHTLYIVILSKCDLQNGQKARTGQIFGEMLERQGQDPRPFVTRTVIHSSLCLVTHNLKTHKHPQSRWYGLCWFHGWRYFGQLPTFWILMFFHPNWAFLPDCCATMLFLLCWKVRGRSSGSCYW